VSPPSIQLQAYWRWGGEAAGAVLARNPLLEPAQIVRRLFCVNRFGKEDRCALTHQSRHDEASMLANLINLGRGVAFGLEQTTLPKTGSSFEPPLEELLRIHSK
jgi:hypothetical protein